MTLKPLDLDTANAILDFSGGDPALKNLGKLQLEGTVALHNMIADPKIGMAYLADEVGMGKTYMALGVVALMRYFNPALRVLYICPSNNVQEKWFAREYRSFTKHNVKVAQYRIRTADGKSAVPRTSCRNVRELIATSSTGYYADFFVGMNSFSMSLTDDPAQWEQELHRLEQSLPAYRRRGMIKDKASVKEQYARALNYILPTFDLVVIDEAHKFKHGFESSDRNKVLSGVLGFRDEEGFVPRVKNALLLSATPYDRRLGQLRNQLNMVGKSQLLPEDIEDDDKGRIQSCLSRFMVRRLNELTIAGKTHTRNMYRKEWRSGPGAEISLEKDEQKLITALVQKKVGEMLDSKGGSPSFQTGLLASFESFAESSRSPIVEFDGEHADKESADAQDRHVVAAISDTYKQQGLGNSLPHPKMDATTKQLAQQMFNYGRKQIVFVRRVKSVDEIKNKLDDHYSQWVTTYIQQQLNDYPEALLAMNKVFAAYQQVSRYKENDLTGGEFVPGEEGDVDDIQPPKNDNIFTWFFRGKLSKEVADLLATADDQFTTPELIRIGLSARNQIVSTLFDINWARALCRSQGDNLEQLCEQYSNEIIRLASRFIVGELDNDQQDLYLACQLGFLQWYRKHKNIPGIKRLVDHLRPDSPQVKRLEITPARLKDFLLSRTLFDALEDKGLSSVLFPRLNSVLLSLLEKGNPDTEQLQALDIHRFILSLCLRTGHGIIDMFISRLRLGPQNLTAESRGAWMDELATLLQQQARSEQFSSYYELQNLSDHLDLIIKTNLPDAYDKSISEYRSYFSQMLNPVTPIIGANGATLGSRSAQARKFRMPGYPLALISTDVFQEGEDLHTFCDSVMHYGLAPSPVGIEQKTGRVDRVGSQAQRRLLQINDASQLTDDKFIQVSFPFVKESIEVLQVRQLCHNINDFIKSLHEVGEDSFNANDIIDTARALQDRSSIPDQIRTPLRSPYVPKVTRKSDKYNRKQWVSDQANHAKIVTQHIEQLLRKYFGRSVLGQEGIVLNTTGRGDQPITVSLTSARASGEMLLKASYKTGELSLSGLEEAQFDTMMREMSRQTFHRTYAKETARGRYDLYHEAEMLIGDQHTTIYSEVEHFFDRFSSSHDPAGYLKPSSAHIRGFWEKSAKHKLPQFGQWSITVELQEEGDCLQLNFIFASQGGCRKHRIKIYESHGHCVFMARAANYSDISCFSIEQFIKYTWQRNALIDIVEFMLDEDRNIVGRAVHPIEDLSYKEFFYCAYTLAVSADRLEYLLQEPDVH
ncbi:DEAD/DEAH box helicase family protein [Dasania marina]|uniref:DEAD/DEAH box helicase family protein n=1 Tax=Dasania marina TaxID=471499 RepID=UPI000363FCA0|nr:DEAD/DEAH box helicase family protein [Dasania marina]